MTIVITPEILKHYPDDLPEVRAWKIMWSKKFEEAEKKYKENKSGG